MISLKSTTKKIISKKLITNSLTIQKLPEMTLQEKICQKAITLQFKNPQMIKIKYFFILKQIFNLRYTFKQNSNRSPRPAGGLSS